MADWYRILQVSRQASESEIKSAYRKLAKKYHPDAHPGDQECEARFKEITEAYTVLSDAEKRRRYDDELGRQPGRDTAYRKPREPESAGGAGKVDFQDLSRNFESFFGFNPRTKEVVNEGKLNPGRNPGNPLDTSKLFEAFMGNMKR